MKPEELLDIRGVVADVVADMVQPPFSEVTRTQAAEYLGISTSGVDRLCKYGKKDHNGILRTINKTGSGLIRWSDLVKIKPLYNEGE